MSQEPAEANIKLTVFNVIGQEVATLINGVMKAGTHEVKWNGSNDKGAMMSSGVYIYKFNAPGFTRTRMMLLTK